jgi:hypothetical protein
MLLSQKSKFLQLYVHSQLLCTLPHKNNLQITLLQGLGKRDLSPYEAGRVIFRCEERTGQTFDEERLQAGELAQYLLPQDFDPLPEVLTFDSHSNPQVMHYPEVV